MKLQSTFAALGLAAALASATSFAAPILPDASGFGPLPAATFGGTGIPNDAVAQTTFNGVTIGLTATPRFSSPAVSNDGAGTFTAHLGEYLPAPAGAPYALWNFDYYVSRQSSTNPFSYYNYRLFYDFDAAVGNDQSTHGFINIPGGFSALAAVQGSENLGANFLAASNALIGLTAPPGATLTSFNPFAAGEYTFKLAAYTPAGLNLYGTEVFNTSMVVKVVPEPGQWLMMFAGLLALSTLARRKALQR